MCCNFVNQFYSTEWFKFQQFFNEIETEVRLGRYGDVIYFIEISFKSK